MHHLLSGLNLDLLCKGGDEIIAQLGTIIAKKIRLKGLKITEILLEVVYEIFLLTVRTIGRVSRIC